MKTPLCFLLLTLTALTARAAELPNILWITSEDNGTELGCYGDSYAITPHIDSIAEKGFRYTNASSTAPVCAPARTTIISGIYPPATGGQHMRSHVKMAPDFKMYPQFLAELGYYCTNKSKEDYNLEKPEEFWQKGGHWRNRAKGQPFFAIFNHTISHESKIRDRIPEEAKIHDPAKAPIPPYHPDTPEVRKDWAQYYDRLTMMDELVGQNLKELEEAGVADDTIIFYYGDHGSGMPRHKRWTYQSGLRVPMIVHFPDKWKHLAPKGYKAGSSTDRLIGFVDLAPTLLSIVGVEAPEWMQGHAFAGEFETPEPKYAYGFRDRMDERIDCVRQTRSKRYSYLKNYLPHKPWGQYIQYMFATPTTRVWNDLYQQGKLNPVQAQFWQTKPAEELYDLENDPHETVNLAESADHAEILAEMRQAHAEWSATIKDVGLLSEYEFHKRANDAGKSIYEMGHDAKLFDHPAIFAAANLATSLKKKDLPEIANLLDHEDSGVRYWGAIGLLTQEADGVNAGHDKLVSALSDPSLIVQVTAAEALGRYGSEEDLADALPILVKHAQPEADAYLAIAAWNAIDYLDDRASSVVDQLAATSPKPVKVPNRAGNYSTALKTKALADLGVKVETPKKKKKG
tara:strand:- start:31763 stop:33646 length:1884 start_codon:yes stop_codon:yes gene_type:complete